VLSSSQARAQCAKGIHYISQNLAFLNTFAQQLVGLVTNRMYQALVPVDIHYQHNGDEATLRLGTCWWVQATDELISQLN